MPATSGVLIDVPLETFTAQVPWSNDTQADSMSCPGAIMSGLIRPSWVGPKLLNSAMLSCRPFGPGAAPSHVTATPPSGPAASRSSRSRRPVL